MAADFPIQCHYLLRPAPATLSTAWAQLPVVPCRKLDITFFFFFSDVIFNLALFIHVACHAAPQKVPGVMIWNREPVARGPDCTLGCCYCWKQHMKSTVAWRIWFIIVVNPGFEHRVWDKKQHSPFNLQTSLCFLNAFNFFPLVSLPLKRCWLRYCPPPLV